MDAAAATRSQETCPLSGEAVGPESVELPEVTVGLKFISALLGFGLTIDAVGRRLRRWRSRDNWGPLN